MTKTFCCYIGDKIFPCIKNDVIYSFLLGKEFFALLDIRLDCVSPRLPSSRTHCNGKYSILVTQKYRMKRACQEISYVHYLPQTDQCTESEYMLHLFGNNWTTLKTFSIATLIFTWPSCQSYQPDLCAQLASWKKSSKGIKKWKGWNMRLGKGRAENNWGRKMG